MTRQEARVVQFLSMILGCVLCGILLLCLTAIVGVTKVL